MTEAPVFDARLEPFGLPRAEWRRFPRYEIRGGLIRPAAGLDHDRYDPWDAYRAARTGWGGRGGRAPYESLFELVWALGPSGQESGGVRLDGAGERVLLGWCQQHGLLGVLSHETEAAYLAPRWMRPEEIAGADTGGAGLVPVQRAYAWGPAGWETADDAAWPAGTPAARVPPEREWAPAPPQLWSGSWLPPRALGRGLVDGTWTVRPLGEAWAPYFHEVPPGQADTHLYPPPLSFEFWYAYAEPVGAFLAAAALFAAAVQELGRSPREGEGRLDRLDQKLAADRAFHGLIAGVHPALEPAADGYRRAWRAKSLLASFAVMAYLDLTEGRRVLDCEVCGRPFVSAAYQARYCSARCRQTATQRAYRSRRRERGVVKRSPSDASNQEADGDGPNS
ncbi:MAG TPA: hypothetical protein VG370_14650 [Chloroflexota bacterium]|nr:hypothetical protein [Chloroflexota bacterium]